MKSAESIQNDRIFYQEFWSRHKHDLQIQLAIHLESRRPLLKLLQSFLPVDQPSYFLEVGCGTALDTCLLVQKRPLAKALAIDLSEKAAALAAKYAESLRLPIQTMAADLTSLPIPSATFDLVFSQGVLEHFSEPTPAVREQIRVLRPGGVLVVDVPQKFNWYTVQKHHAMREGRWDWGWETEYTAGALKRWAASYDLEVCGTVGHQHGKIVDRLLMHPHRFLHRKLFRNNGHASPTTYEPGSIARAWENGWDWLDENLGPHLAINVAVAYRKPKSTRTLTNAL